MNKNEQGETTRVSATNEADAKRRGLSTRGYRTLGALGGALLCVACGEGGGSGETTAKQSDAIWWGLADTVANNAAFGLVATQPQLDRTVGMNIVKANGGGSCTGTMITYQAVLTAAHCVEDSAGLMVWPPANPLDDVVFVGVTPGTDQRALAVPLNVTAAGTVPYVKRIVGPTSNTTAANRDYAVIFLERPEITLARLQIGTPGLTLDGVMGAAYPALNLPTSPLPATGNQWMIWAGHGKTEGPSGAAGDKADRQFQYLTGYWEHGSATNGGQSKNSAGVAYPDQPLAFINWQDGIGSDAAGTGPGQIEKGYFGSDNGDSGGPVMFDLPTGRQLFGLHQSGLTPTDLVFRPGKSRNCLTDPLLCQPTTFPPACFGPGGMSGDANDQVNTGGGVCVNCVWNAANTQCDVNGDGIMDYFRQTPDPTGTLPNPLIKRPIVAFPTKLTEAACAADGTLCQPVTMPRTCFGPDNSPGGTDNLIWPGTYDAAGNAICLPCTWHGSVCDSNANGIDDYQVQAPLISRKVNLSTPTLYGPWCPPSPQTCASIGYEECVYPGICRVASPKDWLTNNLRDTGRPGRLFGERDYAGNCRSTEADPNCDRLFDDQGPEHCPNFFDAEAGFAPELRNNPPVVYGSEGVDLHDRVDIFADRDPRNPFFGGVAAGKGSVIVRNDVRLGRIWGGDYMEVHWRSAWTGALLNNPSTYNFVGSYPPAAIPTAGALVPSFRYTARPANLNVGTGFPATAPGAGVTLQNCTSTTPDTILTPGAYSSSLTINGTCKVRLTAGKYYFDSLSVQPDAQIKVDHSGGAIEVFVKSQLDFKGRFVNVAGRNVAHVLTYFGGPQVAVQSTAGFLGTFVAPNATLELNSRLHVGAFYAKKVIVHQDADVRFAPCASTLAGTAAQ